MIYRVYLVYCAKPFLPRVLQVLERVLPSLLITDYGVRVATLILYLARGMGSNIFLEHTL